MNIGKVDRYVRLAIASLLISLLITGNLVDSVAVISGVIAFILVATALVSFCPLYRILGLKTVG